MASSERQLEHLRAPITQIPCLELPPFEVPDSQDLIIPWNYIQSLVAPFGVFAPDVEDQPLDRPLDTDADRVTPSIDVVAICRGRNVKFERDFLRRREREVFERLWPRMEHRGVS